MAKKLTFKNDQMGSSFTECSFMGSICQPHSFNSLCTSLQSPRHKKKSTATKPTFMPPIVRKIPIRPRSLGIKVG